MREPRWREGSLLAYTEGDGPGRPPAAGARGAWLALAGALSAVFVGVISTDTLCPEHRAVVNVVGSLAFLASVGAIVGLLRGSPSAPALAVAAALGGVAIGLIDAVHDPTRGRLIAIAFALVAIGAAVVAARSLRVTWWERNRLDGVRARSAHIELPAPADAPASEPSTPVNSPLR
jgi:hypothetical protein